MARRLRIEFPGALYHVLSRGDRREAVFRDEKDRERFIETLGEACGKTGWKVHAFVLMPNHFHIVVETPNANLAAGMKWLLGTYTGRFNRRHGEVGHLFSGRYKSLLVGGEGGYLRTVVDYAHLNPIRAKLMQGKSAIRDFSWSSFPLYLTDPAKRPVWLRVETMLGECGIPKDSPAGRREFERRLEERRTQEIDAEFHSVRRGWCLGDERFRRELLERVQERTGANHYGPEVRESEEQKAERMLMEEMDLLKWSRDELAGRRKGDPAKVRVAERLRRETTMTLQWIAARLFMGTKGHLSHLLYWGRRGMKPRSLAIKARQNNRGQSTVNRVRLEPNAALFPPIETLPPTRTPTRIVSPVEITKPLTDPVSFDTSFD